MVREVYSEEFRRNAVELYRTTEGSTVAGIAADLGIMDTTLSTWLKAAGVPVRGLYLRPDGGPPPGGEPPERELARLRARWPSWRLTSGNSPRSGRFCGRRPSISPEVKRMCQLIDVHRSAFHASEAGAARAAADEELAGRIRAVHAAEPGNRAYGAPRVTAEANDGADPEQRVNHKRVARVMAEHGIARIRAAPPRPDDDPRAGR